MQKIDFKYVITSDQKLFVEKGLELLHTKTIDTYRLRLHNPKTIIEELVSVCQALKSGYLANPSYAKSTADEVSNILGNNEHGLCFNSVNMDYYVKLIKTGGKGTYNRMIQASKLVLMDNTDYLESLLVQIQEMLYQTGSQPLNHNDKKKMMLLTHYSGIELVNMGFTKRYLYDFFKAIFVRKDNEEFTFEKRFEAWRELGNAELESFDVIFEILGNSLQYRELLQVNPKYKQVNKKYRAMLPRETPDKVKSFLEDRKKNKLISLQVKALDHFRAVEVSRAKVGSDLDLYHLGFSENTFQIGQQVAVIGERDASKASILPSNYHIDGDIKSSRAVFNNFLQKVGDLSNLEISPESVDKVISAIRYLRMGSESPELEMKLLNYWIGLEYIFTFFADEEKTIDKIKEFFPSCHGLIYIKRNLYDFHKSVERLGLADKIENYSDNLAYLGKYDTFRKIMEESHSQLMIYRAEYYQKWTENPGEITKVLERHKKNLMWNLGRIYRIRNEIVHNAAAKGEISANVSHLRYYLTFILNSILDFFHQTPIDVNNNRRKQ